MGKRMTTSTRDELIEALRNRYRKAHRRDKTRILDEFVAVSSYHRKHAIRLLNGERMRRRPEGSIRKACL